MAQRSRRLRERQVQDEGVTAPDAAAPEATVPDVDLEPAEAAVADPVAEESRASSAKGRRASRSSRKGADADAEPAAEGRRSGRRSQARSAQSSAKKSKPVKPKRTAAESAALQRAVFKALVWILVVLVLAVGGFFAYEMLKPKIEPAFEVVRKHAPGGTITIPAGTKYEQGERLLSYANDNFRDVHSEIKARKPDLAADYQESARNLLSQEMLGRGMEAAPSPEDERLSSVDHAMEAYELMAKLAGADAKIDEVRRDLKVELNLAMLLARLTEVAKEQDLDALETACTRFQANPVEPDSGAPYANLKEYERHLAQLKGAMHAISSERALRQRSATSGVETSVNAESQLLIDQYKFSAALALVDQMRTENTQADLNAVRSKIITTEKAAWETAQRNAENNFATAIAATTDPTQRAGFVEKAVAEMQRVIDNYGDATEFSAHLTEAKQLLDKYQSQRF